MMITRKASLLNKVRKTLSVEQVSSMNYNELKHAVRKLGLQVENQKKETLVAVLLEHVTPKTEE